MRTVVFIGHNECYELADQNLEKVIVKCIESGVTCFLSGGQGGFDRRSAGMVFRLKKRYPHIQNILVIPYLSFRIFDEKIFDEVVYPEGFERYYFKRAIIERNKYMVLNSQTAICYVNHDWGGAFNTYQLAEKSGLEIINLSSF